RTRNHRLTAIRSFFHYASYEEPAHSLQIQRVLAIPEKRFSKTLVKFLDRAEVDALLVLALQTGLRLSELTAVRPRDLHFGIGAHVRCLGKGRKERCTPLTKQTVTVLKTWMQESAPRADDWLFSTTRGGRLSPDAVQDLLDKHRSTAAHACSSLEKKRVTPHVLRHYADLRTMPT